ncbi:hypothetical protein [Alicyclobacillus sp. SO9]|uniref:hypothetical protein n=1 Tax=Alicyclobacillus sp. SO9 TaxID=2665646 RepID=UPI0018E81FEB|nr:hypothetical protein [Alicyclobacillus sp. SO9]QQE81546.1 hypothetical protein GI364_24920 [Alicyclobacillus sp. SO9]
MMQKYSWKLGLGTFIVLASFFYWYDHRPQRFEQRFLNFIPKNEIGAPHNMKYLVEHDAGDGGYYKSNELPGKIVVTPGSNGSHLINWTLPSPTLGKITYKFELEKNGFLTAKNTWSNQLMGKYIPSSAIPTNSAS